LIVARAEAAAARAQQSDDQALIAHLKLQIEKLNRDRYGPRSERTARLLDQLELTLEELEAVATEDELAAEMAAAKTTKVASFTRKRPSRKPFPDHLPRERMIVPGPVACSCCGGVAAVQAWRGHHRDTGGDPEVLEGDPARPREVQVPGL
jgi:transposase